jgi:alpha-L-rhamnosidase
MTKYLERLSRSADNGLITFRYGDWLALTADEAGDAPPGRNSRAPVALVGTAGWYYLADLVARIADVLGLPEDAAQHRALASRIHRTFVTRFVGPDGRITWDDDQTAPALALSLGLAPGEHRGSIARQLIENVATHRKGHLNTGFIGLRFVPAALSEEGRADLAVKALTVDGFPGYVHMIRNGASSPWENWRGDTVLIHPGLVAPCIWLYEGLAGIRADPNAPGYKRTIIRPAVTPSPERVEAWYRSPHGRIAVRREVRAGLVALRVEIPPNTTAEVHVPAVDPATVMEGGVPAHEAKRVTLLRRESGHAVFDVGSGVYEFTSRMP